MLDWLLLPIDLSRSHEVSFEVSWHGRAMVFAWGFLAPLAIVAARFFKILPWQDWPNELDSQLWWRCHWMGQGLAVLLTVFGVGLILGTGEDNSWHGVFGYSILAMAAVQVVMGIFRGSKGGPTDPGVDGSLRGDHYDMTSWRLVFERIHKSLGYFLLAVAALSLLTGMWSSNAPRWMWISLFLWWACLTVVIVLLQRKGWTVGSYQAIWGPDPKHPGNRTHVQERDAAAVPSE